MSNQFDLAVSAAATLMVTLDLVAQCDTEEPYKIMAGPGKAHACVLADDGELAQKATGERQNEHNVIVRCYIPRHADAPGAESILRQLVEDVQDLFQNNVTLDGASGVRTAFAFGSYRARYQEIGEVMMRVLDMPLKITIDKAVVWQQT